VEELVGGVIRLFVIDCLKTEVVAMGLFRSRLLHLAAVVPLLGAAFVGSPTNGLAAPTASVSTGSCQLSSAKGQIQHVINIQFDNTHFTRDNPNVPSDLEQMPNLLSFIEATVSC
jgi:hypothetical protein